MPSHARWSNASWGFVMSDQLPLARPRFFVMGVLLAVVLGVSAFSADPRKDSAQGHALKSQQTSADKTLLLDDDFEGDALDEAVWNTCHWWNDDGCTIASNDELEWYRPEHQPRQDREL